MPHLHHVITCSSTAIIYEERVYIYISLSPVGFISLFGSGMCGKFSMGKTGERTLIETANDKQFPNYFYACQQFQNTNTVIANDYIMTKWEKFLVGKRQKGMTNVWNSVCMRVKERKSKK